ncbi:unnamed protein product, partial [Ascophyllum nodosum]
VRKAIRLPASHFLVRPSIASSTQLSEKPWIGAMKMRFSFRSSAWWIAMICV